jgi:DNA repair protein RadC
MEPSQRPRERLLEAGPEVLSDAELLAVLLRTGRSGQSAVDQAHDLLHDAGGLLHVARMDARELTRRRGLGLAKAATVMAAVELGQRMLRGRSVPGVTAGPRAVRGLRLRQPGRPAPLHQRE